ncbi:hypothetical protein Dimus_004708 [Dionaea muscipula]
MLNLILMFFCFFVNGDSLFHLIITRLPAASPLTERCSMEAAATKSRSGIQRFHDQSHRERGRVTTSHQETTQIRTCDRTTITRCRSRSSAWITNTTVERRLILWKLNSADVSPSQYFADRTTITRR